MDDQLEPDVRVVVNGEPVEGADPLFIGSMEGARDFLLTLPPEHLDELSVFTDGAVYRAEDIVRGVDEG